jgi:DNA-directed RNA polymerase subunit H (RpoH/RPB5)
MELEVIRENIHDMLQHRGDDVSFIMEQGDAIRDPGRFHSEVITLDTDRTIVFFTLTKEILKDWLSNNDQDTLLNTYKNYNNQGFTYFMLIITDLTSANLNKISAIDKALNSSGAILQVFYTKELMYNPLKHSLVPPHEKLSESEGKEIMEIYMIKQKIQMPIIAKTEVIARWLGLKQGDIVKITRFNETSGTYYYYRCCV